MVVNIQPQNYIHRRQEYKRSANNILWKIEIKEACNLRPIRCRQKVFSCNVYNIKFAIRWCQNEDLDVCVENKMDAIINRKCQEFEAQGQYINVLWNACKKCNSSGECQVSREMALKARKSVSRNLSRRVNLQQ